MARNIEDLLNRESLARFGQSLYGNLFGKRPALVPLVLAIVLLLVAWSAFRSPVEGSEPEPPRQSKEGTEEEQGNNRGGIQLSRDFWSTPRGVSYKLKSVYTMAGVDYAIINGKDLKVGDRVEKATVLSIERELVKIQEEDKDHPTELRLKSGGLNLEVVLPPTPTPAPTETPRPERKRVPKEEEPTPTPEPEPVTAEWDWSSWPGPPEMLEEVKSTMLDASKRKEARAEWEAEKDSEDMRMFLSREAIDWIDRCFDFFEANG